MAFLVTIGVGGSALAQQGTQIDSYQIGGGSVALCTLGQSCTTNYDLGFNVTMPYGEPIHTVQIYREGFIVLGTNNPIPLGATTDDIHSLGGAFLAPAFSDFAGLDVSATIELSGGHMKCGCLVDSLGHDVNDDTLIDWFVSGLPANPNTGSTQGEFQIRFHTYQYGTGQNLPEITFGYGGQQPHIPYDFDPNGGARFIFPGSGVPAGAQTGYQADSQGGIFGTPTAGTSYGFNFVVDPPQPVPEPASWALLLLGFGGLGAALRARRRATTAAAH